MKLFHYTGTDHVHGIERDGILGSTIPMVTGPIDADGTVPLRQIEGWQWLTDDPSWSQPWATQLEHNCDRTAVRFIVCVPKSARSALYRWRDIAAQYGYTGDLYDFFALVGGGSVARADHWYVFNGRIPPGWLRGIERRPADASA